MKVKQYEVHDKEFFDRITDLSDGELAAIIAIPIILLCCNYFFI